MDEDSASAEVTTVSPMEARVKALDEWVRSHIHNTAVSADTAAYNRIHWAVQEIKTVLASVKE